MSDRYSCIKDYTIYRLFTQINSDFSHPLKIIDIGDNRLHLGTFISAPLRDIVQTIFSTGD
jgi:hypothetical protein